MEISKLLFAEAPLLQTVEVIFHLSLAYVLYVRKLAPRLDCGLVIVTMGVDKSI